MAPNSLISTGYDALCSAYSTDGSCSSDNHLYGPEAGSMQSFHRNHAKIVASALNIRTGHQGPNTPNTNHSSSPTSFASFLGDAPTSDLSSSSGCSNNKGKRIGRQIADNVTNGSSSPHFTAFPNNEADNKEADIGSDLKSEPAPAFSPQPASSTPSAPPASAGRSRTGRADQRQQPVQPTVQPSSSKQKAANGPGTARGPSGGALTMHMIHGFCKKWFSAKDRYSRLDANPAKSCRQAFAHFFGNRLEADGDTKTETGPDLFKNDKGDDVPTGFKYNMADGSVDFFAKANRATKTGQSIESQKIGMKVTSLAKQVSA